MQNPHSTRLDENQFFTEHKFITSLEALSGALSLAAKKFNDEFSLSYIFHFIHVGGNSEKELFIHKKVLDEREEKAGNNSASSFETWGDKEKKVLLIFKQVDGKKRKSARRG